ncbi:hypothetical protein E4U21_005204 [Claviceps maximensis]|nr:hypothetical protein E4U21_005204 [Claviceps maximensis]
MMEKTRFAMPFEIASSMVAGHVADGFSISRSCLKIPGDPFYEEVRYVSAQTGGGGDGAAQDLGLNRFAEETSNARPSFNSIVLIHDLDEEDESAKQGHDGSQLDRCDGRRFVVHLELGLARRVKLGKATYAGPG